MITYNALISACKVGKQPDCSWEVLRAMRQQGLTQDVITYNAAIWAQGLLWALLFTLRARLSLCGSVGRAHGMAVDMMFVVQLISE